MTCEEYIKRFEAQLMAELTATLVRRTPIDTGLARSSWVPKLNTDGFEINNNVDYIVALEEGHSKQAPAGFNRITCDDAPVIADRVIAKL